MKWLRGILMLVVLIYFASGISQIRPEERGVIRRFGRVVATPGPGLWVSWPIGIDRVDRVSLQTIRQCVIGSEDAPISLVTGDQNLVSATIVVGYSVDPQRLERFVIHQDIIDGQLMRMSESLVGEWANSLTIDDILLNGRVRLTTFLKQQLPIRLAGSELGVILQQVSVQSLNPPEDVREAFSQVNEAQAAMQTKDNQARQDAFRRVREAETMKIQFDSQSQATRIEKLSNAKADAQAFAARLDQYRILRQTNPEFLASIWWDETGRILLGLKGKGRIDLLDSHLGPNGLDLSTVLPPKKR